jgi:heme/copper-type cytochrome/quinol oxidase subunit 2
MNKKNLLSSTLIILLSTLLLVSGCTQNTTTTMKDDNIKNLEESVVETKNVQIKEFNLDSYNSEVDGEYAPRFSMKEIVVNNGDLVKINVNTLSGTHDFKIDEFDVFAQTPEGEVTTVEFTADKSGEYIFYCSKGKHRELGQWGKLIIK